MESLKSSGTHLLAKKSLLMRGAGLLTAVTLVAGSVIWQVVPAHAQTPPAPTNIQVASGETSEDGTIVLTWSAVSTAAYYQVFRFPGAEGAVANELTYLGRTETAQTFLIDTIATEGTFKYAVMAVSVDGNGGEASAWAHVTVDLPDNGLGTITPDLTPPPAAASLDSGGTYSNDRNISLTWNPSGAPDLWRYLVYRSTESAAAEFVAYVEAGTHTLVDPVAADKVYTYYVIAQDQTGNASPSSVHATVVIDTIAPVVTISSPQADQSYTSTESLAITANIAETGVGYEATAVKYFLGDQQLSDPTLDLSTIAVGAHTVTVQVTDRAGNVGTAEQSFTVSGTATSPAAPQSLTAPAFSKTRGITLNWSAPSTGTVTEYQVYRLTTGGTAQLAGTTLVGTTQFVDTVSSDGVYSYYVVAMNGIIASPDSNVVAVVVDTVAPAINITAPVADQAYEKTGTLPVQVTISDVTSGYAAGQVKHYLDEVLFTGNSINLADLNEGSHTFQVDVTDRAGNAATKSVTFTVTATTDEDEQEPQQPVREELVALMATLRSEIHHGHYNALMAKLQAGKVNLFVDHVIRHQGRFISNEAAVKLLKAAGVESKVQVNLKLGPVNNGKGKGNGKN